MSERIVIGLLFCIFGLLALSICGAVYLDAVRAQQTITIIEKTELTLPEKCREFYNDSTDRWIECIGVGYK